MAFQPMSKRAGDAGKLLVGDLKMDPAEGLPSYIERLRFDLARALSEADHGRNAKLRGEANAQAVVLSNVLDSLHMLQGSSSPAPVCYVGLHLPTASRLLKYLVDLAPARVVEDPAAVRGYAIDVDGPKGLMHLVSAHDVEVACKALRS